MRVWMGLVPAWLRRLSLPFRDALSIIRTDIAMRLRVVFILLVMLPALILPGGVAGVHCLSACCAEFCSEEMGCCGSEEQPGVQISEIPSCCLETAAWVTPNFVRGGMPEARVDVDFGSTRPMLNEAALIGPTTRLHSGAFIETPPRPPDNGRVLQLLI